MAKTITSVAFIFIAFIAGLSVGNTDSARSFFPAAAANTMDFPQPLGTDISPVWKVWATLDQKFVRSHPLEEGETEPDAQDRIWGMAAGLAASLNDPYTTFFPPEENEQFKDDISGSFEGVGMEVAIKDGVLTVVSPLKDTPSYKAGILAGDKILKIDTFETDGVSVENAVKRIRGQKGTSVSLTIMRDGFLEPKVIPVTRDVIQVPIIKTKERKDGIFVIEFYSFAETSPKLFRDALTAFEKTGYDKLVIDLRGNPGGYLEAAVDIASWFLPAGEIIVTEDYGDKRSPIIHRSKGYNIFSDKLKLVILTDKGSASASEILTGALVYHKKATQIGSNTFGKGSVQELIEITPETSLKVTVARWLMPDNNGISKDGIAPQIEVEIPKEVIEKNSKLKKDEEKIDPAMDRAVQFLHTGK